MNDGMDIREHLSGRRDPATQQQDPPPRWDECGIEEKVKRLRRVLVETKLLAFRSRGLTEKLTHHNHDALGHVTVRLDEEAFYETGFDWLK